MKIARFTQGDSTRLGIVDVDNDQIIDVGGADSSLPTDVGALLDAGRLGELESSAEGAPRLALSDVKLEAPIARPPAILAIGLNYAAHVAESGMTRPDKAPVVFNKALTCVIGPGEGIEVPTVAPTRVDYEGELAVIIGTKCRTVSAEDAYSVVAGYTIINDVSVRDWQLATPTMTMGKSWDTHGPMGPWIVTGDEIGDPHDLRLRTWIDGDLRQDANTSMMITHIPALIAHLSTAFTLLPGTVIATGTPAGVGFAMDPPRCMDAGSVCRIEIDKIGYLENPVIPQPA